MRIAVCERDAAKREALSDRLYTYAARKKISFSVTAYGRGEDLFYDLGDHIAYDIIFAGDVVKLPCIAVARRLRDMGYVGVIVLLSDTARYAVEGYDVEASAYLIRPIADERLATVMDRILHSSGIREIYRIRCRSSFWQIPYREILYIESNNTKCILHRLNGQEYVIYKTLNVIETELADHRFLRSHQSFLVNMDYIASVDQCFRLVNGDTAAIRQRDMREIKSRYLAYHARIKD